MTIIRGKAWVFGDGVDTDALAPGAYLKAPIEEMAKHCLEGWCQTKTSWRAKTVMPQLSGRKLAPLG